MSEPRYREWILETIDSLRSRKARPDLERICRMVRRRHGSDPDRTRAELDKLIQEQTVLKVSYKGSISYRNAAKVQRKCRKKAAATEHASFDNNPNNDNNINSDGAPADLDCVEGEASTEPEPEPEPELEPEPALVSLPVCLPNIPDQEKEETVLSLPANGNGIASSCGATGSCTSATTDGGTSTVSPGHGAGVGVSTGEGVTNNNDNNEKERKTCSSAGSSATTSTVSAVTVVTGPVPRNKPPLAPSKTKLKTKALGRNGGCVTGETSPDLGDRLVAAVRSLSERNRGSAGSHSQPPGLKEILGYLSTQAGLPEEKLTRNRVKVVLEREIERGRLRRSRLGHITVPSAGRGALTAAAGVKPSARLSAAKRAPAPPPPQQQQQQQQQLDGHLAEKKEAKEEEAMETVIKEEEKMQEEPQPSTQNEPHAPQTGDQLETGVKGQAPSLSCQGDEMKPDSVSQRLQTADEQLQSSSVSSSSSSSSSSPSKQSSNHQEAEPCSSEDGVTAQVTSANTSSIEEEKNASTPDQIHTQDPVLVSESLKLPSSIPLKSYSVCKTEVGVSSCLLTPSASPGAAEERVMNGGIFVKSESSMINPMDWTVADVASYFTAAGFPEQALAFRTQEIDGKSLLLMQRNDVLTGLSIRLGPALKIYERHVKVLQRTHFQDDEAFC